MNGYGYQNGFQDLPLASARFEVVFNRKGIPCDFEFSQVNPAFEALFSQRYVDIVGGRLSNASLPIEKPEFDRIREFLVQVLQNGVAELEQWIEKLQKWYRIIAYPQEHDCLTAVIFDITEKKKAEGSVAEESERFSKLFQASIDAVIVIRQSDGLIIDVNNSFLQLSRFSHDEMVGKSIIGLSLFTSANLRETLTEQAFYESLSHNDVEVCIRRKDDSTFTGIISAKKILLGGTNHICIYIRDITLRTIADEALIVSEANYRRLFESAKDGILILDAETGKIISVNPFLIHLLEYTEEEILEKYVWELGVFKDVLANRENFLELQRNEYIRYENLPLETSGGKQVFVEFVSNVYLVGSHKVIQCNIRDITERKRTEAALVDSEANYRRLFEAAKDGILILDAETGRITSVNPFLINLLGYTEDEFLEKCIWDLGIFKDILANLENFLELQNKEYIRYENLPLQTADGRQVNVEFVSNVYMVGTRKVIQCNIRDITERKQLEAALEKEKRIYEITLISVGDGVISCDNKNRIVFLNKAAELLTEWPQAEAKNQPLETVFHIVDEFTRRIGENIMMQEISSDNLLDSGKHILLITKYGIERAVEYTVAPIIEENGAVVGSVLVFRDFSEKRLEQRKIEFLSYHDQLTGLYNRRFYEEELSRLDTKRNLPLAIVMGDVNGLKLVNDSFGHIVGDELLKRVAAIMQNGCRADDILARLGGDEFVLILPKTDSFGAEQVIQRIKELMEKEKVGAVDLSVSFGYEVKRDEQDSIAEIFKGAEDHLYRHKLYESLSMRSQTISLVLNALFEKNTREMLHSKRVGEICELIATKMGLSEENIRNLKTAGLMHDIGKIGIDESILNKPERLTDAEWEEMKRHPEIGYRILSSVSEFSEIAVCVLEHHERWDGTGYPRGLKGDEICLEARIVGFADAYDAMTCGRSYRNALGVKEALIEINNCSGTQFDPAIVCLFAKDIWGEVNT